MTTAALTIHLPKEDLEFARRYAEQHQITLAELIDRQLKRLRMRDGDVGQEAGSSPVPEVTEDLRQDPDYAAYQREKKRLQAEHPGEYVAYCRGRRVALAASQAEIFSFLDTKFPDEPCFVQHVSQEPRRVTFRRPRRVRSLSSPG